MVTELLSKSSRLRWWVAGALASVGLTIGVFVFLYTTFARASDFEPVQAQVRTNTSEIVEMRASMKSDTEASLREQLRVEEDYHWSRAQLWEIAKRVGAPALPAPQH